MWFEEAKQSWWCNVVFSAAFVMVLGGGIACAQGTTSTVKDDLFAGTEKFAKGASDVTEVTMDPDTLDMVGGKDAKRAHNMVLNVVRTYEYDKPGMYNIADVEEFRQRLNTGDWHCSVHTRDSKSGESTDICNKRRTDGMTEQAIITVEPKELTFIHTIRRRNGDGGSLEGIGVPGFEGIYGLPPAAMMAAMRPEMEAQMMASMAEMRAHRAEMLGGMGAFQGSFPQLLGPLELPQSELAFLNGPVWKEQQKQLQEQLQHMPATSPEGMKQLQDQMQHMQTISPEEQKQLDLQTHQAPGQNTAPQP